MTPIIRVENLGKRYKLGRRTEPYLTFRESVMGAPGRAIDALRGRNGNGAQDFWALDNVSFEVMPGDVVGIVGRNGAGKSTLLKVLSRITEPTTGRAEMFGRIGSLLEVGTGFHPELTGRENIYLNGAILGMRRTEIKRKFDEIVSFAEIEGFIETPVKHYSSGMYTRLAFSVAAFMEAEILAIDEVLAVGDAKFQEKCLGKMSDVAQSGRTVLFVSHNSHALLKLCEKGILLQNGRCKATGSIRDVLNQYLEDNSNSDLFWKNSKANENDVYFSKVTIELRGRQPVMELVVNSQLTANRKFKDSFIALDLLDGFGGYIGQALPSARPFISYKDTKEPINVETVIELPPLIPGRYKLSCWIGSHFTETIDWVKDIVSFDITDSPTADRTHRHGLDRGFCVPISTARIL
jgi:lipopolysaccharide transport system ATP-binding protein